ncbi:TlpA disulfide reductase family protein [Tenacibaculum sp. IB213877]|uniref:TlpA family protein disulfide reductase n=1 Tax=Tenacibaculum sp. IB213877 TaxID=3097351 RepID=UPI002A59D3F4|nr:TlpA disulfide reductase family protein [Tenacibaculum sp. IB213877]MDY0781204.1 TlpA disulfide reductase family protein [Tenacibaculum sp. IB213877]
MKKILALLVFVTSIANAQFTIRGTMTPPDKGDWVILYKLEGAKQKFVQNSTIQFDTVSIGNRKQAIGRFELTLPADAKPGSYRVNYRERGGGFVDFLFNKENVEFVFNPQYPDQSVLFTKSIENKVYREYLEALSLTQRNVDSLQVAYIKSPSKDTKKKYKKAVESVENVQEIFEGKSKGMLAYNFIKSSKSFNPDNVLDDTKEYLNSVINNYFTNIDFKNQQLYNSSFFIDKVTDYVFYLNIAETQDLQQKLYKESIDKVMKHITEDKLRKEVAEYLITKFTAARNSEIVDGLFDKYYSKLPSSLQDAEFREDKLATLRASVGRTAPDFSWTEEGTAYKLSTINDANTYLLVFWSTGCPHCVDEVPALHTYMQKHKDVSVISFGIEMNDLDWKEFVKNLPYFHNAIGTHPENKFDNETVQKYNLTGTPTYFVLNKDKKIIAMPNNLEEVKNYFSNSKVAAE